MTRDSLSARFERADTEKGRNCDRINHGFVSGSVLTIGDLVVEEGHAAVGVDKLVRRHAGERMRAV